MARNTSVTVKQSGYFKPPMLDNGSLTKIGSAMVAAQRQRWAKGISADGNPAKPLSKKYLFLKKAFTGQNRPIRDNRMTGALTQSFGLRKAINGVIRAEATTRRARAHALRAQQYEEMIGFAGSDQVVVFTLAKAEFGKYLQRAWVPVSG